MNYSKIILFVWIVMFQSCSRYDSCRYFEEECRAIIDLVPLMVDLDYMIAFNKYSVKKPLLYIINELHGEIYKIESEKLKLKDRKILNLLIRGDIPNRLITQKNIASNLSEVKLVVVDKEKFESNVRNKTNLTKETFGYLVISRIAFDRKFQVGFVEYYFFCGEACAWKSIIKIKKNNDKWVREKELVDWRA